ncbi:MAG: CaiB/BaiF CoA-transferase family protein [Deltaproteobacteria bacterium]|nr:CaiB/BaiF CoA-transferase family protein [Deltaproteobacteria bacterium]
MSGPLIKKIKVLEMAHVISGPYAGMLLADLGADVIKVEMPGTGDYFRIWDGKDAAIRPSFAAYNRGKRSVTINVQTQSGQELYLRLASKVDVVLENFRPGTLERFGVGYEAIREENPDVIYCSLTGMGPTGPYKHRPTYDAIAQAMSGLWSQLTDMDRPEPVGPAISDQLSGLYAAYGILGALVSRFLGGRGQKLDVSMLGAGLAFQSTSVAERLMLGVIADKLSRAHRSQSYAFVASDGLPFAVHLSTPQKFWQGLAETAGRPELVEDPRFKTKAGRVENYEVLREILAGIFKSRPRAEWLAKLEERDVPSAPIYNVAEALDDPQVQHLGMSETFGEGARAIKLVGFPVAYSGSPCKPDLPVPYVGEHNENIFGELGYNSSDLGRMKEEGAI